MADESADGDLEQSGRGWADEDTFYAMESLQATLQHFEAVLRQQDISEASSSEYCDNFCQALMHYAGSRNSAEHGLTLLEVYCLSINCFASARPHLTANLSSVALVLKRLALSCFELLLSVPQNEIPFEAWLQFHGCVQAAHEAMLEYGSTDLQALVQITGEGGAWSNPALVALLTEQPTEADELNAYLGLEGGDFLEMRIKHLEKVGEVEKALILTKACGNCSLLPNQSTFRQTYVTQLCRQLPSEDAMQEISALDGKDVLDIICNMETEGDENTAFILCTTYLTQQLQKGNLYCSWELTLFWSKLQRRLDGSLESFLERCLQFGAIAKTVYHLLFLIRVIQTEVMHLGLAVSVELCVKALQLPRQEYPETKTTVCETVACLLMEDLEILRACQLTEFFLSPSPEVFSALEDLYKLPDQKYAEEKAVIPNSLRCELLLALKAHWPCDPEFWDWKTLKRYCMKLLGLEPEEEDSPVSEPVLSVPTAANEEEEHVNGDKLEDTERSSSEERSEHDQKEEGLLQQKSSKVLFWTSERSKRWLQYKVRCEVCQKEVIETRLSHHARKHVENGVWTCPVCLQKYSSKEEFGSHSKAHLQMPAYHLKRKKVKNKVKCEQAVDVDSKDLEPGEISLDTSSSLFTEPPAAVPDKEADDDYITFDYINTHYKVQDREVYACPATDCLKNFKLFKYLGVHLKNDHDDTDPNVKHYIEMNNRREKCMFCRRTFITAYHNQKHRRIHYGDCPYMCVVAGCNARFETVNKLITHKHMHSFRLSYHCELKGCSLSFCDLGQLFHHEAQHFRDAAYTCTSPGCKKFYYSRQEFLKHTDTHGITFTEKDFETQRKARRKLLLPVLKEEDGTKGSFGSKGQGLNGEPTNSSSSSQHLEGKDSKSLPTSVAVCFDGKTFTCGLEKCGRTFGKARDIQRHLKIVHPRHLKKENKVCKTAENEKHLMAAKAVKDQDKGPTKGSSQEEQATDSVPCDQGTSPPSGHVHHTQLSGTLTEIVLGLNQLSLNSTTCKKANHSSHTSASKVPQVACPKTVNTILQTKATAIKTELGSHQTAADLQRQQLNSPPPHKPESPPTSVKDPTLNGIKPFTCEVEGCVYGSVTSNALMRHYVRKHEYSDEKVKRMDIFNPHKFRPFKCHLCCKGYKEKKELKAHYIQKHELSKDTAEEILCSFAGKVDDSQSSPLKTKEVKTEKKDELIGKNVHLSGEHCVCKDNTERSNGKIMTEHKSLRGKQMSSSSSQEGTSKDKTDVGSDAASVNRRVSQRLMTKVKEDEDKPYCCLHKGCGAGFARKFNLLRHLQSVHYHRSSVCWQKAFTCKHDGCNKRFIHQRSLNRHYRKVHPVSEDPIPRFKCTFPKCNATYHLKSSLIRHNNQTHQAQALPKSAAPSSVCKFKDVYRRYDNSGPLVVRLQSTHKRESSNSGCQKKLIITPSAQSLKVSKRPSLRCSPKAEQNVEHNKKNPEEEAGNKCVKPKTWGKFVFRTPEEALQMCQDRCLSEAYPCMVQSCNSVVTSKRSLYRHYLQCHKMLHIKVRTDKDTLFYTAEQLEELIQKKSTVSALPDSDRAPNGVLKMKYQAKPENSAAPCLPMSLHSVKSEQTNQEASSSRRSLPKCSVMIGADDMLYGESNGHAESLTEEDRRHTDSPAPPLVPPPPLDLSPPSTLRINVSNASLDPLNRDSKAVSVPATIYIHTNASVTRQPLRGKNSELAEPLPSSPHQLAQKDTMVPSLGQRAFDMGAYKPLGFESSFLKFIQETEEKSQFDPMRTVLNPCYKPDASRRRGSFRHNYSVKENNLRRSGISHARMSHLSPLKSLLSTEECSSIQNLRFILERALMGCGDQAIKQLQFLKPVVVLERPKSSASLLDLLPSETQA